MDLFGRLEAAGIEVEFTGTKTGMFYWGTCPTTGRTIKIDEVICPFAGGLDVYVTGVGRFDDYEEAVAALITDRPTLTEGQEVVTALGRGEVRVCRNPDSTMIEVRKLWSNAVLYASSVLDNVINWLDGDR